jgi:LytS/YehU family sensor histidine kinase
MQEVIVYRNPLEAAMWHAIANTEASIWQYILFGALVAFIIPVLTNYIAGWLKIPMYKKQQILAKGVYVGIIVGLVTMFIAPWFM